jgi:multidrug efflux pump subunit AcrB
MTTQLITMFGEIAALVIGGLIGTAFGMLQNVARRKNEQKEKQGEFKNGWSLMPGSGARVAYLLITLVLIQIVCPMLFKGGATQWWVSGGVALGYGAMLFLQLRRRLSGNK